MARDGNGSLPREEEDGGEERRRHRRSKRKKEENSDGEHDESPDDKERGSRKKRKRGKHRGSHRGSRRGRGSSSGSERDEDSSSSSSDSDSSGEDPSGASDSEESEGEVRRRKRRERRRKEREHEKERRRKEKERRRRKAREEKKRKKEKTKKKKEKEKDKDLGKKGAVTNMWGKYGIIRETDMWNKRPEFTAWLAEVKKVNLESLANWEEKQMFKEFMEDHNTATFPSKKYYDLDAYHRRMMDKEKKKGTKRATDLERTIFNDEELRRQELLIERERQKDEQVEALKRSMQTGMAQAMKEQAQLKEEMAYQYKLGNFEAAAAIQKRLDPDVAM